MKRVKHDLSNHEPWQLLSAILAWAQALQILPLEKSETNELGIFRIDSDL
jgi:hypothetical protein